MKTKCLVFGLFLSFMLMPLTGGLGTLETEFIPDRISANSSFIMRVDPHATSLESVRVTWMVPGYEVTDHGSVPRVGGKWFCYFSSQDAASTCGPSPFRQPSLGLPYTLLVDAVNQLGKTQNTSLNVSVGGIVLVSDVEIDGGNVNIAVYPSTVVDHVSYETYYADSLTPVPGKSGSLEKKVNAYVGSLSLERGEYFVAFTAESENDFGGGVARVSIGVGEGSGSVTADEIVWSPVIERNQHYEVTRFRIINKGQNNLTDLRAEVPQELSSYLSITLANTSLGPNGSMYYTVAVDNIATSMNIETYISLFSGENLLIRIPADIKVTVIGGGTSDGFCADEEDGIHCNGGVCCGGSCITGAECCKDGDCRADEKCEGNMCVAASSAVCLKGECYAGSSCPAGKVPTGETCTVGGEEGVCCEENECAGKSDGEGCSLGVCCSEECVECCTSGDCSYGEECSGNRCVSVSRSCSEGYCYTECPEGMIQTGEYCTENGESGVCCTVSTNVGGGGFDITPVIILVVVALVGVGGFLAYKKFLKKEELPEEEGFEEEDFY